MTIETTNPAASGDPAPGPPSSPLDSTADSVPPLASGDVFTAVVGDAAEEWRVVAVLGIRVLAQRVSGVGERRSFTLRFVLHRIALAAAREAEERSA
ncbi:MULTISPECIES: hypothetical protein [unclassified Rathayibacter]|uniref:hypothetical protein n=1 Tax=unclassified Rathayibacter TaxID=2609250 RepID=UPI00188B2102|nr:MULTISPECIES: hypothetical protein [unclassified Rathayibacter]MBF4463225.1 hypothetical protein [Rathayibacter sp. VKM Ac-2879]MBF4504538.1 hypothetical protein [Rathayibacter sp. VKM Ac-2878]